MTQLKADWSPRDIAKVTNPRHPLNGMSVILINEHSPGRWHVMIEDDEFDELFIIDAAHLVRR